MRPPAEQLIRDYLNRLSVAARSRLKPEDRRAFLARTGDFIERQSGVRGTADPAEVMRILSGIGDPETVVERERVRLETRRREQAAAASRVTLWKPKPRRQAPQQAKPDAGQLTNKDGRPLTGEIRVTSRRITSRWKPGEPLPPPESGSARPGAPAGRSGRSGRGTWIPRPRRGGPGPPPPGETGPEQPGPRTRERPPASAPPAPGAAAPAGSGGPAPAGSGGTAAAGPGGATSAGSGAPGGAVPASRAPAPTGSPGATSGGLGGAAATGSGSPGGAASAGSSGPASAGARGASGRSGGAARAGSGGTTATRPGGAASAGPGGAASAGAGGAVPADARNGGSAGSNGTGRVHHLPSVAPASPAGAARAESPQAAVSAAGPLAPERGDDAAAAPRFAGRTLRIGLPGHTVRIGRAARPIRTRLTRSTALPVPRRRLQPGDVTLDIARRAADAGRQHRMEAVCVVLMIIAGLIYPFPLWLVGFLIWLIASGVTTMSAVWSLPEKWIGIVGPVALVIIGTATLISLGGTLATFPDYVHEALADSVWLIKAGGVLGGVFLGWRLNRGGHRAPAAPPWLRRNRP